VIGVFCHDSAQHLLALLSAVELFQRARLLHMPKRVSRIVLDERLREEQGLFPLLVVEVGTAAAGVQRNQTSLIQVVLRQLDQFVQQKLAHSRWELVGVVGVEEDGFHLLHADEQGVVGSMRERLVEQGSQHGSIKLLGNSARPHSRRKLRLSPLDLLPLVSELFQLKHSLIGRRRKQIAQAAL
jgi:hypothetical protein